VSANPYAASLERKIFAVNAGPPPRKRARVRNIALRLQFKADATMFAEIQTLADASGESLASTLHKLVRDALDNLGPGKVAI
jgi:hypothetical protein